MQWSRVKTIFIVILLMVDGFLFINMAGKYVSGYYRKAENAHNITEILAGRGIAVGRSFVLPDAQALPVLQVDRSRTDEDHFAHGLLGETAERTESADGSDTVRYESERGTVEWKEGGAVSGTFTPQDYVQPQTADEVKALAQKLAGQAGLGTALEWQADAQSASVSFPTAGVPVFNRVLTLTFDAEGVTMAGVWTFGMPYITKSGNYVTFAAADALFTLLARESPTEIDRMELGFLLSDTGGGRVQMTPGWRIDTNAGSFFVDSLKKSSISL